MKQIAGHFWKVLEHVTKGSLVLLRFFLVYEVAAMSIGAKSFIEEAKAWFSFIGSIGCCVTSKFLRSMGELTLSSIGTEASQHEIFAK